MPLAWRKEQERARKADRSPDRARAEASARRDAEMSLLVVEPLRFVVELEPQWVALEQVPEVARIWQVVGALLRGRGYSVWAGVLSAETFGVPQTRQRAVLMASLDRSVAPPSPTHQAYVAGEPAREEHGLFGSVLPWVSMAQALGWGMTARPSVSIVSRDGRSGPRSLDGGSGARQTIQRQRDEGNWIESPHPPGKRWGMRANAQRNAAVRSQDEPSPTITGGHDTGDRLWVPESTQALQDESWPETRPATTIAGDPRVFQPGGHHVEDSQSQGAIRVSVEEAALLQGFPFGYPWQGSQTAQYGQVGNAMPPPMARRVLEGLVA